MHTPRIAQTRALGASHFDAVGGDSTRMSAINCVVAQLHIMSALQYYFERSGKWPSLCSDAQNSGCSSLLDPGIPDMHMNAEKDKAHAVWC
jgi:hypothetical protein